MDATDMHQFHSHGCLMSDLHSLGRCGHDASPASCALTRVVDVLSNQVDAACSVDLCVHSFGLGRRGRCGVRCQSVGHAWPAGSETRQHSCPSSSPDIRLQKYVPFHAFEDLHAAFLHEAMPGTGQRRPHHHPCLASPGAPPSTAHAGGGG